MGKTEFVNGDNFQAKVLNSDVPVLVDFYADWCGPCKMMEPTVEAVSEEFAERLKVYKLNVDQNPQIAAQFHIMSIPTMLIFKNGAPVSSIVGAVNQKALIEKIQAILEE
ncbi:thioredoxin [bacterium]|nr:MAG: thioredoxin [bacterium]